MSPSKLAVVLRVFQSLVSPECKHTIHRLDKPIVLYIDMHLCKVQLANGARMVLLKHCIVPAG